MNAHHRDRRVSGEGEGWRVGVSSRASGPAARRGRALLAWNAPRLPSPDPPPAPPPCLLSPIWSNNCSCRPPRPAPPHRLRSRGIIGSDSGDTSRTEPHVRGGETRRAESGRATGLGRTASHTDSSSGSGDGGSSQVSQQCIANLTHFQVGSHRRPRWPAFIL